MHKICFDPLLGILNVKRERGSLQFCISCLVHFSDNRRRVKEYIHLMSEINNEIKFTYTAQINDVYKIYIHWTNHSATAIYFEWSFRPFLFFNGAGGESNFAIFPPLIRMFH